MNTVPMNERSTLIILVNQIKSEVMKSTVIGLPEQDEMPLERKAPGVIFRQPVKQPLQTGLKAIDAMIPIGSDHTILRFAWANQPGAYGFLTDIQVQETADLALLVELCRFLFHPANQHHLVIKIKIRLFFHNPQVPPILYS